MNESEIQINLTLSLDEVNLVLRSLGTPIEPINSLMQKIRVQGEAQVAEATKKSEVTE